MAAVHTDWASAFPFVLKYHRGKVLFMTFFLSNYNVGHILNIGKKACPLVKLYPVTTNST